MKLNHVVLSGALLLGASVSAGAQAAVYGMVTTERATNVNCLAQTVQTTPSICSSSDHVDRAVGAGGGVYYDFLSVGRARLGVDVRGDIQKGNKSASNTLSGNNALRMDEVLGGVRATMSFHKDVLKPYAEVAAGWNRRDRGAPSAANFAAYRVYFGLDIALLPVLDLRLPEVGIGQNIGFNGVNTNTVESGSVGVVFHLPHH